MYGKDLNKFSLAFQKIKSNYNFFSEKDLDEKIMKGFEAVFHKEGINELTYKQRVIELLRNITYEIISAVDRRSSYICTYKILMQKVEDICERVKDNYYEPDFSSFKKNNKINLSDQLIANSREYKQLVACNLTERRIEEHLIYQQYYESIRYRYLLDNKLNYVENIESTTYGNFCDVKDSLNIEGKDIPSNRLVKTKEKTNFYTPKDQTKYGSCIYLTKDSVDDELRISWEDDHEKE